MLKEINYFISGQFSAPLTEKDIGDKKKSTVPKRNLQQCRQYGKTKQKNDENNNTLIIVYSKVNYRSDHRKNPDEKHL